MESGNRNMWIILFVILAFLCLCVIVVALLAVGFLLPAGVDLGGVTGSTSERIEQIFEVGDAPQLTVDSFAGSITVRAGASSVIEVVATKKATSSRNLDRIEVEMAQQDGDLVIRTRIPRGFSNASVELEVTTPASTRLDLHTGAGSVRVSGLSGDVKVDSGAGSVTIDDVTGQIDAHSGAGSIEVRGASGLVRLNTGAGSISYQGTPQGDCSFESGTGSIELVLPADLSVKVDLGTGVGSIDVEFTVVGQVSKREVVGVIGGGDQGQIYAHTGTGSIDLIRR